MTVSGIYWFYQVSRDRAVYVGSSGNIAQRWRQHRHNLRKGNTHNQYLQRVWNKYGEGDFQFLVLEECPRERLIEREQFWANALTPACNVGEFVENATRGQKFTDEHRAKLSAARRGRTYQRDPEVARRIGEAQRGKVIPQEQRDKIAASKRGKKQNLSDETRRKKSEVMKGNQYAKNPSDETRQKMSEAQKKRFEGTDAVTDETRSKLSEAAYVFWARRRSTEKGIV